MKKYIEVLVMWFITFCFVPKKHIVIFAIVNLVCLVIIDTNKYLKNKKTLKLSKWN
jgi:hypothetical protein